MSGGIPSYLISIHDVTPKTLPQVQQLSTLVRAAGHPPPPLLVCPGTGWDGESLEQLRALAEDGHELAGHGWRHAVETVSGLGHRLHAAVLSRRTAEHLELEGDAVVALIETCYGWFVAQDLGEPELYVPPAWALGRICRRQFPGLPFRYYETLTGIYDSDEDHMRRLPLIGFEADTPGRARALRLFNRVNQGLAASFERPLRIALHPRDLELRLQDDLRRIFPPLSD